MNAEPTAILIRINHGQRVRSGTDRCLAPSTIARQKGAFTEARPQRVCTFSIWTRPGRKF